MGNPPIVQLTIYALIFLVGFLPVQLLPSRRTAIASGAVGVTAIAAAMIWMRVDRVDLNSLDRAVLMVLLLFAGTSVLTDAAVRVLILSRRLPDRHSRIRLTALVAAVADTGFAAAASVLVSHP